MLKKSLTLAIAASLITLTGCLKEKHINAEAPATMSEEAIAAATASSRGAIKAFGGQLKGELVAAMKAGGPLNALDICNTKSPEITASVSEEKGVDVSRVSLKNRNPGNAPAAWQEKVLLDFEARKAAGEDPKTLEHHEVANVDGKTEFRYMKAAVAGKKVCLACHGENIADEVQAKISALYPEDKATGYKLGDIRGAFVVTQTF